METRAVKKGDTYILNGHKTHINDAAEAHVILHMAKAEKGLTVFILEKDIPGVTFTKKLDPIGLRSSPLYYTSLPLRTWKFPEHSFLAKRGMAWRFSLELLRNKAALLESSALPCARETCMAKYFAGEVAKEVTNKANEITGSHGCYRDQPYEMLLRDAKALLVAGGSSEVMKNVIADVEIGR